MADFSRFQLLRVQENEVTATEVAEGILFSSGKVVLEWNRHAFPEDERTEGVVHSHYESVEDVEKATEGTVSFID